MYINIYIYMYTLQAKKLEMSYPQDSTFRVAMSGEPETLVILVRSALLMVKQAPETNKLEPWR